VRGKVRSHSPECERYRKAYAERYPDAMVRSVADRAPRVASRVCCCTPTH
jgi:hypothetical protein